MKAMFYLQWKALSTNSLKCKVKDMAWVTDRIAAIVRTERERHIVFSWDRTHNDSKARLLRKERRSCSSPPLPPLTPTDVMDYEVIWFPDDKNNITLGPFISRLSVWVLHIWTDLKLQWHFHREKQSWLRRSNILCYALIVIQWQYSTRLSVSFVLLITRSF